MAAKDQEKAKLKKRKQIPGAKPEATSPSPKKPKLINPKHSNPKKNDSKKPFKGFEHPKSGPQKEKKEEMSKRERRLHAKVVTVCDCFCYWF